MSADTEMMSDLDVAKSTVYKSELGLGKNACGPEVQSFFFCLVFFLYTANI